MTGEARPTSLIHSQHRFYNYIRSLAPGRLCETGDEEFGGVLSSCSPPQGMSYSLPVSQNESPVLLPRSWPPIAFSPLPLARLLALMRQGIVFVAPTHLGIVRN